jgi:hypothetical protein
MRRTRIIKYKIKMLMNRLKFWRKKPEAQVFIYEEDE